MKAHSEQHPQELLPWYANGTLGPDERQQVEAHLAHCDHCRHELTWLQSVRAQLKTDMVDGPGELGLQRLLRDVRSQSQSRPTRQWWRPALAAAVVIIAVQFVMIIAAYRQPDTFTPLSGPAATGVVLQVKFAPNATEAQIRTLLQKVHASLIDGPGALGIYRVRLEAVTKSQTQAIQHALDDLTADHAIVTYATRE